MRFKELIIFSFILVLIANWISHSHKTLSSFTHTRSLLCFILLYRFPFIANIHSHSLSLWGLTVMCLLCVLKMYVRSLSRVWGVLNLYTYNGAFDCLLFLALCFKVMSMLMFVHLVHCLQLPHSISIGYIWLILVTIDWWWTSRLSPALLDPKQFLAAHPHMCALTEGWDHVFWAYTQKAVCCITGRMHLPGH